MAYAGDILTHSALQYMANCIRNTVKVSDSIDDINLRTDGVFSSVHTKTLIDNTLTESKTYTDSLVANLSRLEVRVVTNESEITEHNKLYLIKLSGETSYSQYVIVTNSEGADEKILLGTCDVEMTDYLKKTDADAKFETIYNCDLIRNVIGTETLATTSQELKGAINEVKDSIDNFSTSWNGTKAEFEALDKSTLKDGQTINITDDYVSLPFRFGIDDEGNYGYYKVGADTVTPFKTVEDFEGVLYAYVANRGGNPSPYQNSEADFTYKNSMYNNLYLSDVTGVGSVEGIVVRADSNLVYQGTVGNVIIDLSSYKNSNITITLNITNVSVAWQGCQLPFRFYN